MRLKFNRRIYFYFAYFDDHYLLDREIKSNTTRNTGLYLGLSEERITYFLSLYDKEVKILGNDTYKYKKILLAVKKHNEKIKLRIENEVVNYENNI